VYVYTHATLFLSVMLMLCYIWGFYVSANFGENPSRNASVRVHVDGHTDRDKLVFTHAELSRRG